MKRFFSSLALLILPALTAPAVTWYVSLDGSDANDGTSSWATAFLTITNAVVRSSAGDLVLVSNGTYNATGAGTVDSGTNFIYLNKAITLKSLSGNPEDTILHGNGMTNRLVYIPGAGSGCVLDGFTLTNGYSWSWVGGGLVIATNALITNCIITGCRSDTAGNGGGGVYCTGPATMAWCRVVGNVAMYTRNVQSGGGGIYCATNASYTFIITNCDIGYNAIGAGEGGGICASRNVRIYNSHIFGNTIVSNAGLIYGGGGVAWYYGGPYLKDCFISNNIQTNYTGWGCWGGGAKKCILDHCQVLCNTGVYGGGVYDCIVSNNSLIAGNYATYGGGAYDGTIRDSTLTSNSAPNGGAVYPGSLTIVSNCVISANWALNSGGGVYYYVNTGATNYLIDCTVVENVAKDGGGVYFQRNGGGSGSSYGLIQNCLVARNVATNQGGGVYFSSSGLDSFRGVSCTIVSNYSVSYGGGIRINDSVPLTNCLVYHNLAGVGANDIYGGSSNYIWNSCVGSYSGTLNPNQGNLTDDPQLVSLAGNDYRLGALSPCRNAGVNLYGWMLTGTDLGGTNSRILYSTVDMGAYEYTDGSLSCVFSVDHWSDRAVSTNVFTAIVNGSDLSGLGYQWDFTNSGGFTAGGAIITNEYPLLGHYTVVLRVTNAAAQSALFTNFSCVKVGPLAYYVATNGGNAFPYTNGWNSAGTNLNEVVNWAQLDGDVVWVSNGFYGLRGQLLVNTGVTIQGWSTNPLQTVVSGQGLDRCFYLYTNAVVANLTLTNSGALRYTYSMYQGAGFWCTGGTLRNCIINGCMADSVAGGYLSGGLVTNCLIVGNRAGKQPVGTNHAGGIYIYLGGTIANCVFCDNQVTNNSPAQNLGGAIYTYRGGLIKNCVFSNNFAPYGGAIALRSAGTVQNCLFISNQAVLNGGAIYATNDPSAGYSNVIVGCTIAGNTALTNGGGVYVCSNTYVLNTIVMSNTALVSGSNYYNFGSGIEYQYCDTQPLAGLPGVGNTDGEPAFINYANGNFRLGSSSPCINAGTNQVWMETAVDLLSRPRIYYGRADMGCYEYFLDVKVNGIPIDRILRINGVDKSRIIRINR